MKDIDWSKAPEGATHYLPERDGFSHRFYNMDKSPMLVDFCEGRGWEISVNEPRGPWMESLVARPTTPHWNGTGLPPVGVVCLTEHEGKDLKVEILAYGKHGYDDAVLAAHLYDGARQGQMYGWIVEQCDFRPIRTSEQIAAEEREAAIKGMVALCPHPRLESTRRDCGVLYDAGYRMTVEDKR